MVFLKLLHHTAFLKLSSFPSLPLLLVTISANSFQIKSVYELLLFFFFERERKHASIYQSSVITQNITSLSSCWLFLLTFQIYWRYFTENILFPFVTAFCFMNLSKYTTLWQRQRSKIGWFWRASGMLDNLVFDEDSHFYIS